MKKGTVIAIVAALVAVGLVVWWVASSRGPSNPTESQAAQDEATGKQDEQQLQGNDACPFPPENTVVYCDGKFTAITVSAGAQVTFTNASQQNVQPMSDPHPTHTNNSELNIGPLAPGESKTVTLTKKGEWGMHDHLSPSTTTRVVVQ